MLAARKTGKGQGFALTTGGPVLLSFVPSTFGRGVEARWLKRFAEALRDPIAKRGLMEGLSATLRLPLRADLKTRIVGGLPDLTLVVDPVNFDVTGKSFQLLIPLLIISHFETGDAVLPEGHAFSGTVSELLE